MSMTHRTYIAFRCDCGPQVAVANSGDMFQHLPLRCDVVCRSSRFEWAYRGAPAQQLAVAMLTDHGLSRCEVLDRYFEFTCTVIGKLDYFGWEMTSAEIEAVLGRLKKVSA